MAAPIVKQVPGGAVTADGGVQLVITPPLEFIGRQTTKVRKFLEDFDPLWDEIEPAMSKIEEEQFDTEGHGEWPELAWSTIIQKHALGYGGEKILHRTHDLRESLIDPTIAADRGDKQLVWGSDVPYSGYHQSGTPKMPARPPIDIRVEDRQKLEAAVVFWLNAAVALHWNW